MRHTQLTNIGFVKLADGTYYNSEVHLHVQLDADDDKQIVVHTTKGNIKATIDDLEDTIVGGGFGDF